MQQAQAKLANHIAKDNQRNGDGGFGGVFSFAEMDGFVQSSYYYHVPVDELWGVGRRYAKKLEGMGVKNAFDFVQMEPRFVQKHFTIQGLRLQKELQGIKCFKLENQPDPKKEIASTRSFGKPVRSKLEMKELVAQYCTRVGEKLRKEQRACSNLQVFITTNRFKENRYIASQSISLASQSNYTPTLIDYAYQCLDVIWREGMEYKKAGVIVTGLVPQELVRVSLFDPEPNFEKMGQVSEVMDLLNKKYGCGTLKVAATGFNQQWQMNRKMVSPRYTTRWGEMLSIK